MPDQLFTSGRIITVTVGLSPQHLSVLETHAASLGVGRSEAVRRWIETLPRGSQKSEAANRGDPSPCGHENNRGVGAAKVCEDCEAVKPAGSKDWTPKES
jgi:hypothetical protein